MSNATSNATLRENAQGLIPVEQSKDIVKGVQKGSAIMRLSKIEPMATSKKTISVLGDLNAYVVGEGEAIGTDKATFTPVELETKKYAIIVPFSNELINESIVNVVDEIKDDINEQFARLFDSRALTTIGTKVGSQTVVEGATAGQALHEDLSDAMALIEAHGHDVNGFVTKFATKNRLRKLKDEAGNALYTPSVTSGMSDELYGQPIEYSFGVANDVTAITGDFKHSVVGIQGDINYTLLTEATVGDINLAEQDMSALRVIANFAHVVTKDNAFSALKSE